MRALLLVAALSFVACNSSDPSPRTDPPAAPSQNDPAYPISGVLGWYLVGNDLTPGGDTLTANITAPDGTGFVDAWVAGAPGVRLAHDGNRFQLSADLGTLAAGNYDVLFAADGDDTAFAKLSFARSAPYYVLVSTDWDFSDPGVNALAFQDTMHQQHPTMRVTNFVGPYLFTDPVVTPTRRQQVLTWIASERDDHAGEIALHIHPYCNFVEYAGVTCDTADSTTMADDPSGYTVGLFGYSQADMLTLLHAADQLFMDNGLAKPTTFRAGGWTATIDTMRALAADGFVADTSALNWATIEEWVGHGMLYEWNMANWSSIGDTSQPYYPNDGDILSSADPALSMLEVPDNGSMVDYVSVDEMTNIFDENWDGSPLAAPTTMMMGWHPSTSLTPEDINRVDGLLTLTDQYQAKDGTGPVVYEVLRDMPTVFTK